MSNITVIFRIENPEGGDVLKSRRDVVNAILDPLKGYKVLGSYQDLLMVSADHKEVFSKWTKFFDINGVVAVYLPFKQPHIEHIYPLQDIYK